MSTKALSKKSVPELVEMRQQIDGLIQTKRAEEKQQLVVKIRALAADHGLSIEDVIRSPARGTKKGSKVAPKYRRKSDPGTTWSGRGMKPKWFQAGDYVPL